VGCFDVETAYRPRPTRTDAKHYMNQVVTNKQQLGIPLMMVW
jgi:hypothetical protein